MVVVPTPNLQNDIYRISPNQHRIIQKELAQKQNSFLSERASSTVIFIVSIFFQHKSKYSKLPL